MRIDHFSITKSKTSVDIHHKTMIFIFFAQEKIKTYALFFDGKRITIIVAKIRSVASFVIAQFFVEKLSFPKNLNTKILLTVKIVTIIIAVFQSE